MTLRRKHPQTEPVSQASKVFKVRNGNLSDLALTKALRHLLHAGAAV